MPAVVGGAECTRVRMVLSLALDGEAAGSELREAAWHLERCASCRGFAGRVVAITGAFRFLPTGAHGDRETTDWKGGGR